MAVQIQLRNDTAANWTSSNPTLAAGELGVETDTGKLKVGDGTTAWTSLSYFEPVSLSELNNVTITNAASGEALTWNGSAWVNTDLTSTITANIVDSAPTTLDTLNELAAALGDDANFATTVTTSISNLSDTVDTKAPLNQTISSKSANYSIQTSDSGSVLKVDGTVTITLSDNVLPAGGRVDIINVGSGTVTIAGGGTMTVNSKGAALTIDTQYAAASLIADSATTSFLIGDIA